MNPNRFVVTGFADRLAEVLHAKGLSQSQLATRLAVSRSTVTGWMRYGKLPDGSLLAQLADELKVSADWLLGIQPQHEQQNPSGNIRWIEQIPAYIPDFQREALATGIDIFRRFVVENQSAFEVRDEHHSQVIRAALQSVFRSGAIQIIQVSRNETLEKSLKTRYPFLKQCVVADVPEQYDDTLIRAELVAFLAANEILSQTIHQGAIGLGSGYTLARTCELSIPSGAQFVGTYWVPLLAFARPNWSLYTASDLARLMAMRHPGSRAVYLPHPDECVSEAMKSGLHEATRMMGNLQTIFVSVSGVDRRDRQGDAHFFAEFRSADYELEAPDLRLEYAQLADKNAFGGELLRYLINEHGEIVGRDPDAGSQVDLAILRHVSDRVGTVCLVAASPYKARATYTCLENRIVNALVIDSEIATYILAQHP
ncbi:MAG: helix-turn-helix domain-containing protein [Chloroflexota bacterium]